MIVYYAASAMLGLSILVSASLVILEVWDFPRRS